MSATITSYTIETVDLTEVKAFCRVDGSADDSLLTMLWKAACQEVTSYAHFIAGTATITVDQEWVALTSFPSGLWVR